MVVLVAEQAVAFGADLVGLVAAVQFDFVLQEVDLVENSYAELAICCCVESSFAAVDSISADLL